MNKEDRRRLAQLERQIQNSSTQIDLWKSEIERINSRIKALDESAIFLAEELHKRRCHCNHIDACDWGYRDWEDVRLGAYGARKEYYDKAVNVLEQLSLSDALAALEILG